MSDYKQCIHRREGVYAKDSWQTYNACTLHCDRWDYYDCDPTADYCTFNNVTEKTMVAHMKEQRLKDLVNQLDNKQRQKLELEEEIEIILQEINDLNI